jgi:hypothetical protein
MKYYLECVLLMILIIIALDILQGMVLPAKPKPVEAIYA